MIDVREAKELFRGPMVSVATPFTPRFDLDLDALRDNIEFMLDRGMATGKGVLLVAAAGGEFPMLTMEERKEVIRASVEAAAGRIPVAASVQFDGTRRSSSWRATPTGSAPVSDSSRPRPITRRRRRTSASCSKRSARKPSCRS